MTQSVLTSPIDSQYTAHRVAERRRRETREWLEQRERELGAIGAPASAAPVQHEQPA